MELTSKQQKRLKKILDIEKNPTLSVIDEIDKLKGVLKKIKDREDPEQREDFSISNPEDIKNDIISEISQIRDLFEKYIANKMAIDEQKHSKMIKHTSDKEKSLGELKNGIIQAIQNLAENIPEENDYSNQFRQVIDELKNKKEISLKTLESGLEKIVNTINNKNFLEDLVEYNRLKVTLSKDNIKEIGRSMSISIQGGAFPEKSQNDLYAIRENQTNREQYSRLLDSWGDEVGSTMIDELMISEKIRVAGGVFNGSTPDTNFYTTTVNANGTATISNSVLDAKVTADSGSSVMVYTNTLGRYIGGNMGHLRGIFRPGDAGVAGNTRMIGLTYGSDLADSIYFQLSGTTFSIVANTTGLAQIKIDNGSFNGDSTTYPVTNVFRTWEILFTNKRIQFYIDKVLIHTLTETTFPICGTRHLRPFIKNINTGVVSETHLYCQSLTLFTWGKTKTQPKYYNQVGLTSGVLLKNGIGSLHSCIISNVTNNANVTLYDGTSTAGTLMWSSGAMSNQTVPLSIPFNDGISFLNGLYLTITGAACNANILYE